MANSNKIKTVLTGANNGALEYIPESRVNEVDLKALETHSGKYESLAETLALNCLIDRIPADLREMAKIKKAGKGEGLMRYLSKDDASHLRRILEHSKAERIRKWTAKCKAAKRNVTISLSALAAACKGTTNGGAKKPAKWDKFVAFLADNPAQVGIIESTAELALLFDYLLENDALPKE